MCRKSEIWNKYGWIVFLLHGLAYIGIGCCLILTPFMAWYILVYYPATFPNAFRGDSISDAFPFGNFSAGGTGVLAVVSGIVGCVIGCKKKLNRESCVIRGFFGCSVTGIILALYSMGLNLWVITMSDYAITDSCSESSFVCEKIDLLKKMRRYDSVYYESLLSVHWWSVELNISYTIIQ